ncbi:hypothetical protein [Acinetobacter sp. NIPH 2699]|uniref:hypothetical protein n=1 Tax=Acinetobacter sp. NIPH 2699 TaxID=2923433 RepID=UPI001F4A819C|nr:hypothetical protein [Acinetobacter sp. NIPH 2699]MCH7336102.1 hypothetical protein [Acinetobacter sp. NIPH 2699]
MLKKISDFVHNKDLDNIKLIMGINGILKIVVFFINKKYILSDNSDFKRDVATDFNQWAVI